MAALGYRTFNEMVGQSQCLDTERAIGHWKARGLDFEKLFHKPEVPGASPSTIPSARTTASTRCSTTS